MSDLSAEPSSEPVGYGRPPRASQFRKGQSGNPKGRPRNRRKEIPYDTLLGQMVTIREDGRERRVTAAEAFILQLTRKGLQGDSAAARASLTAIETARAQRLGTVPGLDVIRVVLVGFGVSCTLTRLGLARKVNPLDEERVAIKLQPWIVEAALSRLGGRRLTVEEQTEVWDATDKPRTVKWPEWWSVRE